MNTQAPQQTPDFRAVLTDDRLSLIPWSPTLLRPCGPANRLLRDGLSAPPADITIVRDPDCIPRELVVSEFVSLSGQRLREALIAWASLLGYERIWFSDHVVQVDRDAAAAGSLVTTDCTTCGAHWTDASPEFWIGAQRNGVFPIFCPVCGHPMPQWSVPDASCAAGSCSAPLGLGDHANIAARPPGRAARMSISATSPSATSQPLAPTTPRPTDAQSAPSSDCTGGRRAIDVGAFVLPCDVSEPRPNPAPPGELARAIPRTAPAPVYHARCGDCGTINDVPSLPTVCYRCGWPVGI